MNNLTDKLWSYFYMEKEERKLSTDELIIILKKYGIFFLLKKYLPNITLNDKAQYFYGLHKQRINNKFFKHELKLLSKEAFNDGIDFILLKGLSLAEELYDPVELRCFGDIDLLVSINSFKNFVNICKKQGYHFLEGKDISDYSISKYLNDNQREHHFSIISKEVEINDSKHNVCIEIHTDIVLRSIFNISYENKEYSQNLFNRKHITNINGIGRICTLELHDNVIFLLLHFTKHYSRDIIIGFISGNFETQCKINLLHDIVLLMDKRKNLFNIKILKNKAIKMGIINEILFPLFLISEIYTVLSLALFVKNNLYYNQNMSFISKMCYELLKKDSHEILFTNQHHLICDLYDKMSKDKICYNCFHKNDQLNKLKLDNFFIRDMCLNYHKCTIISNLSWNCDMLLFEITVNKNDVYFCKNPRWYTKQDYVEIMFETGNREKNISFVKNLVIKPKLNNDILKLQVWELHNINKAPLKWKMENICHNINIRQNGYFIALCIPQTVIGCNLKKGTIINFDIIVNLYQNKKNNIYRIPLSNKNSMWHIPSEYSKLYLC